MFSLILLSIPTILTNPTDLIIIIIPSIQTIPTIPTNPTDLIIPSFPTFTTSPTSPISPTSPTSQFWTYILTSKLNKQYNFWSSE